jgi:hypothetical protein
MFYIILHSQLGNQLFQIFNGISLSLKYNRDYKLCLADDKTTINGDKTYFHSFLKELKDKTHIIDKDKNYNITHKENDNFLYNEVVIDDIDSDNYIKGFYQSYKYFENYYEDINKLLNLDKKRFEVKEKYNNYFKKKTIAIHFRFADYIGLQYYHNLLRLDYYIKALNSINITHDFDILYFCHKCDNKIVDIYIDKLKGLNINFIKVSDDIPEYEQMLLMSNCDVIIMANSTFSWFSSYMSKHNNIIYPNKWFGEGNKHKIMKDLFKKEWHKIDNI